MGVETIWIQVVFVTDSFSDRRNPPTPSLLDLLLPGSWIVLLNFLWLHGDCVEAHVQGQRETGLAGAHLHP